MANRWRWLLPISVLLGLGVAGATISAQVTPGQNYTTTPTFSTITGLTYVNFGATVGTDGYGLRDNGGNIEFKNSGGGWTAIPSAVASVAWDRSGTTILPANAGDSVTVDAFLRVGRAAVSDGILITPVVKGGAQFDGTITSADLTAARTWTLPDASGTFAFTANNLSVFAATTSAQLAGVLSDETGTGSAVFSASPTFTGTVTMAGVVKAATVKTTTYTATTDDYLIVGNHATVPFTITLLDATTSTGRVFVLKNIGAATLTISATGLGGIFAGSLVNTISLAVGDSITVMSDGTRWVVL